MKKRPWRGGTPSARNRLAVHAAPWSLIGSPSPATLNHRSVKTPNSMQSRALPSNVDIVEAGERLVGHRIILHFPHRHEPFRFRVGEFAKNDALEHREDRRAAADADGQGQRHKHREPGSAGHLSQCKSNILASCVDELREFLRQGLCRHQFASELKRSSALAIAPSQLLRCAFEAIGCNGLILCRADGSAGVQTTGQNFQEFRAFLAAQPVADRRVSGVTLAQRVRLRESCSTTSEPRAVAEVSEFVVVVGSPGAVFLVRRLSAASAAFEAPL